MRSFVGISITTTNIFNIRPSGFNKSDTERHQFAIIPPPLFAKISQYRRLILSHYVSASNIVNKGSHSICPSCFFPFWEQAIGLHKAFRSKWILCFNNFSFMCPAFPITAIFNTLMLQLLSLSSGSIPLLHNFVDDNRRNVLHQCPGYWYSPRIQCFPGTNTSLRMIQYSLTMPNFAFLGLFSLQTRSSFLSGAQIYWTNTWGIWAKHNKQHNPHHFSPFQLSA